MARAKYLGIVGDQNPIEHQGGIVYEAGYGPHLLYFQPIEDDVYVHDIPIADDVFEEYDWADVKGIAKFIDMPESELRAHAKSDNVVARADVLAAIGDYHGWSSGIHMTIKQAERKYGSAVDAAHKAQSKSRAKNPDEDDDDEEHEGDLRWANMAKRLKNAG